MFKLIEAWQSKVCSFEERLAAQRKEREMAQAELGFKKPLTKEELKEKKKQRLAAIGNSLVLSSFSALDKHFFVIACSIPLRNYFG